MKIYGITVILFLVLGISQQVHSQQDMYKWRLSAGTGFMEYYGDLNRRFVSPVDPLINTDLSYLGYKFSVERFQSKATSIRLSYSQGQFIANDRAIDWKGNLLPAAPHFSRSLNARTNISDLSLQAGYSFDNGHLLGKNSIISPYLLIGAGITFFEVYGDLFDESGRRYFYWSDNTIRTLAETEPDNSSAEIIQQDGNFETNLTNLHTEQYYPNRTLSIPFTAGIKIRTIDRLTLALELTTRYTLTDYLDDVSGDFRTEFDNTLQQYASNPKNVTGNKRGSSGIHNDIYSMFSVSIQYSLGKRKNVFNAIKIFPSNEKDAYLNQILLPVWQDQYVVESDSNHHPVLSLPVNPNDTVPVGQNVKVDELQKITIKDSQVQQIVVDSAWTKVPDTVYADTVKLIRPFVFPKMADDTLIAVPPYFIPRKTYIDSTFTSTPKNNPDKAIITQKMADDTLIAVPPYFIPGKIYTDSTFTSTPKNNPDKAIITPKMADDTLKAIQPYIVPGKTNADSTLTIALKNNPDKVIITKKISEDTLKAVPPYFAPGKTYTDSTFTSTLRNNPDKVTLIVLNDSVAADKLKIDASKPDTLTRGIKTRTTNATAIVDTLANKEKSIQIQPDTTTAITLSVKATVPAESVIVVPPLSDSLTGLNKAPSNVKNVTDVSKGMKKTGFPLKPDNSLPKPSAKSEPKIAKTTVKKFSPVAGTDDQQNIPTSTKSQKSSFNPVEGIDESQNIPDGQPKRATSQQVVNVYPAENKVTTAQPPVYIPVIVNSSDQALEAKDSQEYALLNDRLNLEMEKSLFYKEEAEFYKQLIMHNLQSDSIVKTTSSQDSIIQITDSIVPAKLIVQDTLLVIKMVEPIKTVDSSSKKMEILINKISIMEKELAKLNGQLAENQQVIQLPSTKVFFASGSYQLSPTGKQMLQKIIDFLNTHDEFGVQLNGYADKTGNPQKNLVLSKKRAQAVSNYLISKKIVVDRIRVSFNGEDTEHIGNNLDYARRVEINVLKF